jgi:hypothetical protein
MSQHGSGFPRKAGDLYETPEWVTEALLSHLPVGLSIWKPAAATGKMARVLGPKLATDIDAYGGHLDFLAQAMPHGLNAIITNPPHELAREFIEHALRLTKPVAGVVGMLLRGDYDDAAAPVRQLLAVQMKLVLTKRIVWFDGPHAAPSFNHAWYLWDWGHVGAPILAYGPAVASARLKCGASHSRKPAARQRVKKVLKMISIELSLIVDAS